MDRTNRNTALASAMVEELARCGVRHACIAPGSRSTPLALALWRQPAIETSVHIDERCAGFFALGAAQATGRPAAVLCTSGSAAANLHPAVVEADEAAIGLLVLTADRPPELRGIGAGQTIDQIKLYGSAVRWFSEVGVQEADDDGLLHMRATACRAYAASDGDPRPGPVHLNFSWRDPLTPEPAPDDVTATSSLALEGRGERPLTAVTRGGSLPDGALLDELAERIASEPSGLILAGRQADRGATATVVELAATAGYPVLAEPTSQLRCGHHDRSMIVWPYDAIARARPVGLQPRLVVRVGDMPTSKALRLWLSSIDGLRQVVIDPLSGWNEPTRRAETLVRADPGAVAAGLSERLRGRRSESAWAADWVRAGQAAAGAMAAELALMDAPSEPGVHAALSDLYRDGDLVYTASSMPIRDQECFCPSTGADVKFLCNRGANGIDGLLSSGLGAAAASGRRTFIVIGDLGLYHDMNGLLALARMGLPANLVVLNNDGGGIFHFLPQAESVEEFEPLFGTPTGLDLSRVAALYGLEHRRVEDMSELPAALTGAGALVEVPVDRRLNVAIHARLFQVAAEALQELGARK